MDMITTLREYLSQTDFDRMMNWMSKMPSEQQAEMMKFMLERETQAPAVGVEAPDFTLPTMDRKSEVSLSSFRGDKPVALIFGSFT